MNFADIILSAGRCQTEEEADNAISAMLSPSDDRKSMGEVYVTVMGYNPITYFSEREITSSVNRLIDDNFELKNYLVNEDIDIEKIASLAMKIHYSHRERDQVISIKEAFWALCPDLPTDLSDIINDIEIPKDNYDTGGPVNDDDDEEELDENEFDDADDEEDDEDDE